MRVGTVACPLSLFPQQLNLLLALMCANAHVCQLARTDYALRNGGGMVVCPNELLPQQASMRGEMTQVW